MAHCVCGRTRAVGNILREWHAKGTSYKSEHKLRHVLQFPRILGSFHRPTTPLFASPTPGLKVAGVCLHPLDVAAPAVLAWMLFSRQFSVITLWGDWELGLLFYVNCWLQQSQNPKRSPSPIWTATIIKINSILAAGFKGSHLIKWPHACSIYIDSYIRISCGTELIFIYPGKILFKSNYIQQNAHKANE